MPAQHSHQRYGLINIYIEWSSLGELIKSFDRYGSKRRELGLPRDCGKDLGVANEEGGEAF